MALYLGLDSSTQGLTAVVIDRSEETRAVVLQESLLFGRDLPRYGTTHGVLHPSADRRIVMAPPTMWAEALDVMMARVADALGPDRRRLAAIGGSAQQHGSVYLTRRGIERLLELDPGVPLVPQLADAFSRPLSPIWMDTSTSSQCRAFAAALGGDQALATLTGSRAFERFTGPQIRRFFESDPDGYLPDARRRSSRATDPA
jgi:xylulokinase